MSLDGGNVTADGGRAADQADAVAPAIRSRRTWRRALRRPPAVAGAVVVLLFAAMAIGPTTVTSLTGVTAGG